MWRIPFFSQTSCAQIKNKKQKTHLAAASGSCVELQGPHTEAELFLEAERGRDLCCCPLPEEMQSTGLQAGSPASSAQGPAREAERPLPGEDCAILVVDVAFRLRSAFAVKATVGVWTETLGPGPP